MTDRAPLPPINFKALNDALLAMGERLLEQWLPDGRIEGHEYKCGSTLGGEGDSCSVNVNTGAWSDFATGEKGGDLISLFAATEGIPNDAQAAIKVAHAYGLTREANIKAKGESSEEPARVAPPVAPKPEPKEKENWAPVVPVPPWAPAATFWHWKRNCDSHQDQIDHIAEYRVGDDLWGYVVRFLTSTGGKDTLPHVFATSVQRGSSKWVWRGWDDERPLYLPSKGLPNGRTVVVVEGEKKADILQTALDAAAPHVYCVVSWVGGSKAWQKAPWAWLQGCTVLLWPDCDAKHVPLSRDEVKQFPADDAGKIALAAARAAMPLLPEGEQPGMAAMLGIGEQLKARHGCVVSLLKIPAPGEVMDGWDCADALGADGWTGERVLEFFGTAFTPTFEACEPLRDSAKKIEGPVGTDAENAGSEDLFNVGSRVLPGWLKPYYNNEKKQWMASRKMVIAILRNDEALEPILYFNELSGTIQARYAWPWPNARLGDYQDADDLQLGDYLTTKYGLPSISRAALVEGIQTVAHTRRFHPIREYLESLPKRPPGSKSRIDSWLIYAMGESPESLRPAMFEYLSLVGRYWLLGMVNRVMQPGCKFDYAPVLEGVGGLRKSTLCEVLAGSEYFGDTQFEVGKGKEGPEQIQGRWIYEFAELSHLSKAEVGAVKAFISSKVDRYRAAYGTTVNSHPRQVVLVGTTNENTYLRDRTGNRRFWPIPVKHIIKTEWVQKYRDDLFAEAYQLYLEGARYTPTPEQEERLFVPMQESRLVETAVLSELQNVLTRNPTASGTGVSINNLADFVTIAQLTLALGVDAAKSSPALEAQIRGWLDFEGWTREKKQINGVRAWGYQRPADWPRVKKESDMEQPPEAVAGPSNQEEGDDAPI